MHGMLHWIAMRYAKDGVVSSQWHSFCLLISIHALSFRNQTCNAVAPALIIGKFMNRCMKNMNTD